MLSGAGTPGIAKPRNSVELSEAPEASEAGDAGRGVSTHASLTVSLPPWSSSMPEAISVAGSLKYHESP